MQVQKEVKDKGEDRQDTGGSGDEVRGSEGTKFRDPIMRGKRREVVPRRRRRRGGKEI